MLRTDVINYYMRRYPSPKSYLEVGVRVLTDNFSRIEADVKDGIDPNPSAKANYVMTSDEFFKSCDKKYDLVFIDGLHTYEQSYRDVLNTEKVLNENGMIIMHDCNPPTEAHQVEEYHGGAWNGTVWKTFVRLRCERNDLEMFVIDTDWGIGVIKPHRHQECFKCHEDIYNYKVFEKYRNAALRLMSIDEWLKKENQSWVI